MTDHDVLFGYRLQLFDLAARMTVSTACRVFGVHRGRRSTMSCPVSERVIEGLSGQRTGRGSSWGDHLSYLDAIAAPVLASELPTAPGALAGSRRESRRCSGRPMSCWIPTSRSNRVLGWRAPPSSFARRTSSIWPGLAPRPDASVWPRALTRPTVWPGCMQHLESVSIRYRLGSGASGLLLPGWLASRVRWEPRSALRGAGVPQATSTPSTNMIVS
jgi:hypothetical protein